MDHLQKTRCQVAVHSSTTDSAIPLWKKIVPKQEVPKLITSKEQILKYCPDVIEGIGKFPGPPYHIRLDPGVEEVNKMLHTGVFKPVLEPHHGSIALFL